MMKSPATHAKDRFRADSIAGAGSILGVLLGVVICGGFFHSAAKSWLLASTASVVPTLINAGASLAAASLLLAALTALGSALGRLASTKLFEEKSSSVAVKSSLSEKESIRTRLLFPLFPQSALAGTLVIVVMPVVSLIAYAGLVSYSFTWFWKTFCNPILQGGQGGFVSWLGENLMLIAGAVGIGCVIAALAAVAIKPALSIGNQRK